MTSSVGTLAQEALRTLEEGADRFRRFVDSPQGRRLRRLVAGMLIVSAPMLFKVPVLRRSKILRLVELAGGAAVVVRIAEAIRDHEFAAGR
jgi:hypothetical protein